MSGGPVCACSRRDRNRLEPGAWGPLGSGLEGKTGGSQHYDPGSVAPPKEPSPMSSTTLTRARVAAPQAAPKRPRDPWFDNAKMLLVLLVVVGHSWTLVADTTFTNRLYDWLYLWHIPAFVMVTGYLSRRFSYTRVNLRRLVTTVVLPYLVFEGLLAIFRVKVGGE